MYTNDMRGTSNVNQTACEHEGSTRQPVNTRDQPDALWTQRLVSGQSRAHKLTGMTMTLHIDFTDPY